MAPTANRTAQTSSEVKRLYKRKIVGLSEHQQRQVERALELERRATHARDAESRRKAAKKKREEREEKEARARKQIGVGLATQLAGYSHTQAQLKNGMEAFLGIKKKSDEEKQKKEAELAEELEAIVGEIEKEPWDDDEPLEAIVDLPKPKYSSGQQWMEDGLDDESLLEAHDIAMSDPVRQPANDVQSSLKFAAPAVPSQSLQILQPAEINFSQLHGPIHKHIEVALSKLPEEIIELFSQDMSLHRSEWDPPLGCLHKLMPFGFPAHRLRIKIGCIVTLLKDLNTSSQLFKSQHLRVLRAENDRLECLVLDGQLEGTKAFLPRVTFTARYKNHDQYPFQRTQFPVRVSTEYTPPTLKKEESQTGFKLFTVTNHIQPPSISKRSVASLDSDKVSSMAQNVFKKSCIPAVKFVALPKPQLLTNTRPVAAPPVSPTDGWDDYLDSGTQIARELATDISKTKTTPPRTHHNIFPSSPELLPPLSTQDLDFSFDDLCEETAPISQAARPTNPSKNSSKTNLPSFKAKTLPQTLPTTSRPQPPPHLPSKTFRKPSPAFTSKPRPTPPFPQPSRPLSTTSPKLPYQPQRRPPSVSDRPGLKRKDWKPPQGMPSVYPVAKRACSASLRQDGNANAKGALEGSCSDGSSGGKGNGSETVRTIDKVKGGNKYAVAKDEWDFVLSTQDVAGFFEDEEAWKVGGSPPIQV